MATCNQAVISILQLKTVRLSDTKLRAQGYKSGREGIRFDLVSVCGVSPVARGEAADPGRDSRHTVHPQPSLTACHCSGQCTAPNLSVGLVLQLPVEEKHQNRTREMGSCLLSPSLRNVI